MTLLTIAKITKKGLLCSTVYNIIVHKIREKNIRYHIFHFLSFGEISVLQVYKTKLKNQKLSANNLIFLCVAKVKQGNVFYNIFKHICTGLFFVLIKRSSFLNFLYTYSVTPYLPSLELNDCPIQNYHWLLLQQTNINLYTTNKTSVRGVGQAPLGPPWLYHWML